MNCLFYKAMRSFFFSINKLPCFVWVSFLFLNNNKKNYIEIFKLWLEKVAFLI